MSRVVLPLLLLTALAACGGENVRAKEAEVQRKAAALTGWNRLFGSPATTVASANQFGFRAGAYAQAGSVFQARSAAPIMIGSSAAPKPNTASFVVSGTNAEAIDQIAFTLDLTDPASADLAKDRFSTLIRDFLFQAKADGFVPVGGAIAAEKNGRGDLPGAAWLLTRRPIAGAANDARRIIVTFTRPDTRVQTDGRQWP